MPAPAPVLVPVPVSVPSCITMFLPFSGFLSLPSKFRLRPCASSARGVSADAMVASEVALDMGVADLEPLRLASEVVVDMGVADLEPP